MNDRDRLEQLEGLLARLEQMPASAERDFMLAEVRGRAVDIETGVPNTPVRALPRDEGLPAPQPVKAAARKPVAPVARARTQPRHHAARTRVVAPVRPPQARQREREREDVVDLLGMGGVLNLDDAASPAPDVSRPWSRGLRG
jgi:hypothetical protein